MFHLWADDSVWVAIPEPGNIVCTKRLLSMKMKRN